MQNIPLLTKPSLTEKIRALKPPLPFIYLYPVREPYKFDEVSGPLYMGCGDDITNSTYEVDEESGINGGSSRLQTNCSVQKIIVNVRLLIPLLLSCKNVIRDASEAKAFHFSCTIWPI